MLGSLARWLRLAGFDVAFQPDIADPVLASRCRREGRWLLSRDRELVALAGPRAMLVRGEGLAAQVAELRRRLPLDAREERFFTRCSKCNGVLREAAAAEVADLVPPYVATHEDHFAVCSLCGQVYWPGTHHVRILARLRELFVTLPR